MTKVVAVADSVASGSEGICFHVQPTSSKVIRVQEMLLREQTLVVVRTAVTAMQRLNDWWL